MRPLSILFIAACLLGACRKKGPPPARPPQVVELTPGAASAPQAPARPTERPTFPQRPPTPEPVAPPQPTLKPGTPAPTVARPYQPANTPGRLPMWKQRAKFY